MSSFIFDELFVLEMANNHLGSVKRGERIIKEFASVVRYNNMKAAIKLQFRDVDKFIHKQFVSSNLRYVRKTIDTQLTKQDYALLVKAIVESRCIPCATAFDEVSVDLCMELGIKIIKIASSDMNDWPLIEKVTSTRLPVIISIGGSSLKDTEDLVTFFENRSIPFAVNHCVALYPTEDDELELNQIDFLRMRFPGLNIGFSTHEHHDWTYSMLIAYAKGARTFERHIDIDDGIVPVSPYCSLPLQIDEWFKAFKKAKSMCGAPGTQKRISHKKETDYLDSPVRGVYAKTDLGVDHVLTQDDYYLAIPLQRGQLSCSSLMRNERLIYPIRADQPIMLDAIEGPYATAFLY